MNWTELLKSEVKDAYHAAEGLVDLVDDDQLDWKPTTGDNWMTVGQLLKHLTMAGGGDFRGFVTGDWGMPEGADVAEMSADDMLPAAEKLPAVGSVAEAKALLAEGKQLAFDMLAQAGEERLATEPAPAPWNPTPMLLGHRLLQMVTHLNSHKSHLYYYLKLQGKPVHTGHLWGM
ncbi:MAG: DinB family protein [Anaerolineae bacterium]|nr:DinB family protein [Anaerolineae bacterium]